MPIEPVRFLYEDGEGRVQVRCVQPLGISFRAEPPWHVEPTWILDAIDHDRNAKRSFAMDRVRSGWF